MCSRQVEQKAFLNLHAQIFGIFDYLFFKVTTLKSNKKWQKRPKTLLLKIRSITTLTVSRLGALGRGLHTTEHPSPNGKSGDPKSGIWNSESVTLEAKCSGHSWVNEGSPSELEKTTGILIKSKL